MSPIKPISTVSAQIASLAAYFSFVFISKNGDMIRFFSCFCNNYKNGPLKCEYAPVSISWPEALRIPESLPDRLGTSFRQKKNKTSAKVNDQVHGHPLTDKHVAAAIGTRRGPVTFGPRLEFWTLFGFEFRTDWLVGRLGGGYC